MDTKRKSACHLVLRCFVSKALYRYVAKIIFTYILGYKVDVGHMEAVNLISSSKYSEKQIVCDVFLSRYFLSKFNMCRVIWPLHS